MLIYKITNNINGKIYIGKTSRDAQVRFHEHVKNTSGCKSALHSAIKKYGEENFSIEIIEDNIKDDEINDREKYWIEYYDSYKNGYNLTTGGDGGSSLSSEQINAMYDLYFKHGLSLKEVSNELNIPYSTVEHRIGKHKDYDPNENQKRAKKDQCRAVTMYDEDGNYIMDFISLADAGRYVDRTPANVFLGIKNGTKVNGVYFTYKNEPLTMSNNKKTVYQYDMNLNLINSYNGVREASRQLGYKDATSIIKCCTGHRKTSHGYIWSYEKYDERTNTKN